MGHLVTLWDWSEKLIKPKGVVVAWKGGEVQQEINDLLLKYNDINVDIIKMDGRMVDNEKARCFVRIQRKEI